MIKLRIRKGRYAPVFVCDICGKQIEDTYATAVSPKQPMDGEFAEVLHAHKGACDDEASRRLGGETQSGWQEMSAHVVRLAANVGMTSVEIADQSERLAEIERIF